MDAYLGKARSRRMIACPLLLGLAALSLLLLVGCNEDDIERTIGSQSAAAIESHFTVVEDPLLTNWIEHVGHTCKSHSRRQKIPYEFKIVDTELVNAFAAPYGHVYVTMGLLDFVEDEDEVWFVVAHEVGHIVNRDSIKAVKKSFLYSIPAFFAYGEGRTVGDVTQLAFEAWNAHYSREDEYEADDKGTELAYAAGHDPQAGPKFFAHLKELETYRPSKFESYFLTHPPLPRRVARQRTRDQLSRESGEALIRVGEGYARRHRHREAIELLTRGLELEPDRIDARLILAQAHLARNAHREAREQFEAVLEKQAQNAAASRALASLEKSEDSPSAAPGDEGRLARARELLQKVQAAAKRAEDVAAGVAEYEATMQGKLEHVAAASKQTTQSLLGISAAAESFGPGVDRALLAGNAAVATANEALYVLEGGNATARGSVERLRVALSIAEHALAEATEGKRAAVDLRRIEKALAECERTFEAAEKWVAEAPKITGRLRRATEAAQETVLAMERVAYHANDFTREELELSLEQTGSLGFEALRAIAKPKARVDAAQTRAYVAQLDLATAAAEPWAQLACDNILAYFLQAPSDEREATRPEDVRALRERTGSCGEAALLLAASCSSGQPVENFVAAGHLSLVDAVRAQGVSLRNINVVLKFAANAISSELEVEVPPLPPLRKHAQKADDAG